MACLPVQISNRSMPQGIKKHLSVGGSFFVEADFNAKFSGQKADPDTSCLRSSQENRRTAGRVQNEDGCKRNGVHIV